MLILKFIYINNLYSEKKLQKQTRNMLNELDDLLVRKDKSKLIEARADNIITGAINLINYIQECYDPEISAELERRLLNAIKSKDSLKFTRGIRKLKDED